MRRIRADIGGFPIAPRTPFGQNVYELISGCQVSGLRCQETKEILRCAQDDIPGVQEFCMMNRSKMRFGT